MKILIVSAPSGTGKGTVIKSLLQRCPQLELIQSYTTRTPRSEGENGYVFVGQDTFAKMRAEGAFLEYNCYTGEWYGTPRGAVEQCIQQGKIALVEVDTTGCAAIVASGEYDRSDICSVFITAKDAATLNARLTGRGTESTDKIRNRMLTAVEEVGRSCEYDSLLINDVLEETVSQLQAIVETGVVPPRPDFDAEVFQKQLLELLEIL